ncbi:MAG TPA: type II secretion system protein GspL [Pseudomonadales bacterium]|nr:type II secretion system protein GspL [Pseudomonadales bacterium]
MSLMACVFAPPLRPQQTQFDDACLPWGLVDGERSHTGVGLDGLCAALGDRMPDALVLIVAAEDVLATRVRVPARSRRQFEAALPYVVEEFLAEDVEQLHLAPGKVDGAGRAAVRALHPAVLEQALACLAARELPVTTARVDVDLLPTPGPKELELWVDGPRALLRSAELGMALPRDMLQMALPTLLRGLPDAGEGAQVIVRSTGTEDAELDLADLAPLCAAEGGATLARQPLAASLEAALLARLVEMAPTAGSDAADAPELLRGRFTVRAPGARGGWSRWRLAAGLAAVWFLVQVGMDLGRTEWLEARAETLRAESVTVFQSIFPERTRIPDPRRELENLLGGSQGSSSSFMDLLGVLSAEVGALDAPVQLRSINWNAQRGDLAVDLSAPAITAVDRLKAALEADGYPVTIDSAVQEEQGVRARMRMRSGAEA